MTESAGPKPPAGLQTGPTPRRSSGISGLHLIRSLEGDRDRAQRVREATYRIARAVLETQSLRELFVEIHGIVDGLMPARNFYVALYDEKTDEVAFPYFVDEFEPPPPAGPPGRGLTEYVLRTGEPLLATPEIFGALVEAGEVLPTGPEAIDWLGVPLRARDRSIGVLAVQSYASPVRYRHEDKEILLFVSAQIALAIERRRAESDLRRLTDHMLDVVSQTDLKGTFQFVSPSHRIVGGYEPDSLVGTSALEHVHPDDTERVRETIGRAVVQSGSATAEYRYQAADGRWLWVESVASLIRDEDGAPRSIVYATRDVTARRRAETVLSLLHEADRRILQAEPVERTLAFLCAEISRRLEVPFVWVGEKDPSGRIQVLASAGEGAAALLAPELRWDNARDAGEPAGEAIAAGRNAFRPDFHAASGPFASGAANVLRSAVSFPLVAGGAVRGAITLGTDRAGELDERSAALFSRFADQAAFALVAAESRERIDLQTAALEAAANAVVITNAAGVVEWVNPAFTELTGFRPSEVVGKPSPDLSAGAPADFARETLRESVAHGRVWRGELFTKRRDGSTFVEEQTVTPVLGADGRLRHVISIRQDVTARKKTEERIRHLALHDYLTDLPNRRAVEESLERLVARARRGSPSSLVLLDLDNFKVVNDSLGHAAGDRILVELAKLLVATVRPGDIVARLGGDEFLVLLEGIPVDAGRATAERIRQTVDDQRFQIGERIFDLGISAGVVPIDSRLDASSILAAADAALYAAKEKGRNRVVVADPADPKPSHLSEAGLWASRVKEALRLGRLRLLFQPILELATGRVVHFEALLRLTGDTGDLVSPGAFLPAAERFGLMPQIDDWVVETVLSRVAGRPGPEVFVNLSGSSLGHADLLHTLQERLEHYGPSARRLAFEITETTAVSDVEAAREWMRRLRERGCRFALDDFGIGFSSFAYLQSLPADYVKIDGSFIRGLEANPANRALVKAIQTVAHTLGKETIAESVESRAAADVLREMGVAFGQGYALGPPVPNLPDG